MKYQNIQTALVIVLGQFGSGKSTIIQECREYLWSIDNANIRTTHVTCMDMFLQVAKDLGYQKNDDTEKYNSFLSGLHSIHTKHSDGPISHLRMAMILSLMYKPPKKPIIFYETFSDTEAHRLLREYPGSILVYASNDRDEDFGSISTEFNPDFIKRQVVTESSLLRQGAHLGMQLYWRLNNCLPENHDELTKATEI